LVFYEISAAKRALSPNFITTRRGFEQEYRGMEVTVHRRLAQGWQAVASLTAGAQKENYGNGSFQNPQDIDKMNGSRIASSTPVVAKLMGSYQLPHNLSVSGFYQFVNGTHFTRTVNSTSALGRSLSQGNVVVLAGRRNEESYPNLNLLDLRVGYDLPWSAARVALQFDVFNALNVNAITNTQTLSGTAYGRVVDFVPPRIFRFGAKVRF
jgi:outer membrane receptor protein involved in Fe transport